NEIAIYSVTDILIDENKILIKKTVKAACNILGFDPFYLANEGKMVIICAKNDSKTALKLLRSTVNGKNAALIGHIGKKRQRPHVVLKTLIGGERILFITEGEQLPRIC